MSLVGPSGSGKSSLLRAVIGLQQPLSGTVETHLAPLAARHPVPGRCAAALEDGARQRRARPHLQRHGAQEGARRGGGLARAPGSCGLRRSLSPSPQRRPAQARRARAGAGDEAEAHPDGRAVRLARCDRARPRGAGTSSRWSSARGSAFSWSPTISKRRSAFPTKSICCRRGRARASPSNTLCRFRGRAILSIRACIRPSRRSTKGCGQTFLAKSIIGLRQHDVSPSPLCVDTPACRIRGPARGLGSGRPRRPAQSIVCAEPEPDRRSACRIVLRRSHLAASRRNLHRCAWRSRARHRRRHSARASPRPLSA